MLTFFIVKTNGPSRILLYWGPAIIVMLVIFFLSSRSSSQLPDFGSIDTIIKKSGHILGYALLALTYIRGVSSVMGKRRASWLVVVLSICLTILYAMSDEYHQSFTPGRGSDWTDVGIDTSAGLCAVFLWYEFPSLRSAVKNWFVPPVYR